MQLVILYLSTAVVFLGLDAVMLTRVLRPMFETRLGAALLEDLRIVPAALFYLAYVAGVVWFVSWGALKDGSVMQAFGNGALIGALAYGTYEFTNYATLKAWHWQMVATDVTWGALLTGVSAAVGVAVTRAVMG
ncbi:DUF2177 family protein [Mesobacterium pallidum]|uniref:DUF2177 family protein n=1 Tax=Mesobacterium pallidum TaxID=2872037 RepID=UPI001EE15B98|nr:DUF2177 family protein [Mesobacterium pallidum]